MRDEINEVAVALEDLRDRANTEGNTLQDISIELFDDTVVLRANRSGLLELARLTLMVSAKDAAGAHQDIDRSHFATRADRVLTIALK